MKGYFIDEARRWRVGKKDIFTLGLIAIIFFSLILSVFIYNQLNQDPEIILQIQEAYSDLNSKYEISLNISSTLREYYDELEDNYDTLYTFHEGLTSNYNTLTSNFEDLESGYVELENQYDNLLQEKQKNEQDLLDEIETLEQRLSDVDTFSNQTVLENSTFMIEALGNQTLYYNTMNAGYLEINFTSSSEIIIWIGSSITPTTYYARFPTFFPDVAEEGHISIPACCDISVYILNPSENLTTEVNITITYIY